MKIAKIFLLPTLLLMQLGCQASGLDSSDAGLHPSPPNLHELHPSPTPTFTPVPTATPTPNPGTPTPTPTIPPTGVQPYLIPGAGWNTSAVPQPTAVGHAGDPGFTDKAIARWDVVPYQTVNDEMKIGIVAFQYNGIGRVDFSVNNGPWVSVTATTYNDQTQVWEFTVRLRASDFPAQNALEVRAIVYPALAGIPRVLAGPKQKEVGNGETSLYLFANYPTHASKYVSTAGNDATGDGSSQRPFRSIRKALNALTLPQDDGGEIILADQDPAGWDMLPRSISPIYADNFVENQRWITIRPATGLGRMRVITSDPYHDLNTGVQRTKFQDLVLDFASIHQIGGPVNNGVFPQAMQAYWQERVIWDGPGYEIERSIPIRGVESGVAFYTTNSISRNLYTGFTQHVLVRGCHDESVSGDHYTNTKMIINSTINNAGMCTTCGIHPDIFQYYNSPYYAGVYDSGDGLHHGATWEGATRLLRAHAEMNHPFANYTLSPDDRLFVISGTGVVKGAYEIEAVVDRDTLRLVRSITPGSSPVNLNIGDIFAVMSGPVENIIAYGVKASNIHDMQNWHFDYGAHHDQAFVNIAVDNLTQGDTANMVGWIGLHHLLMINVSAPKKITFFDESATDVRILNSVLETVSASLPGDGLPAGITVENSHLNALIRNNPQGLINTTIGAAYVDGNVLGRTGTGSVQVQFNAATPGGTFVHTGRDVPLLQGSGVAIPGFVSGPWASDPAGLRNKGAFEF